MGITRCGTLAQNLINMNNFNLLQNFNKGKILPQSGGCKVMRASVQPTILGKLFLYNKTVALRFLQCHIPLFLRDFHLPQVAVPFFGTATELNRNKLLSAEFDQTLFRRQVFDSMKLNATIREAGSIRGL